MFWPIFVDSVREKRTYKKIKFCYLKRHSVPVHILKNEPRCQIMSWRIFCHSRSLKYDGVTPEKRIDEDVFSFLFKNELFVVHISVSTTETF